ncbi:glycosyltransferase family 4 protein [Haloarcula pelagica]|uniref:glycosyltransferase family 4 protein n=1 Tax=Haloarcula pelagica TaxID=3033389 RepID=UPI0024C47122|nr:glycosyltransferase family 4 protein [Halomicroarcula sp. YJ-61-S]
MSVGSRRHSARAGDASDPVRVAVVSQQYPPEMGGNASRVGDTARQLAQEGVAVSVVAPPLSYPPETYPRSWRRHDRTSDGEIDVHRLWAWQPSRIDPNPLERLAYYFLFALHATLWLLYHRRRFDAVVCTTPPVFTGIPGLVFGELTRKPLVVDVGDLWIDAAAGLGFIRESSLSTRLSRRYEHLLLLRADRILTTTDEMSSLLERAHGPAIAQRFLVAPNAVDVTRFDPNRGSGDDGRTIVYTGIFGHAQDLEACVRAMALLDHDATLKLVGDGDTRPRLERLVAELGVEDRVEIHGPVERDAVPELLASAAIGVAPLKDTPGLRYAVPLKTYEYMASGLPVVGTDMGAFGDLIEASEGGLAVENSPEALAAAFDELLADPDRRERLGRQAREHVEQHYDRRVLGERLAEMLRDLVETTGGRR